MNYKLILPVVALLAVGATIFLYQTPYADSPSIKIGAAISLTGFASDYGDMAQKAMNLAVEEINAGGSKVELIVDDDQTDPTAAVSAYRKLVDVDHVDAVIGSIFDFTTQPLLPLALKDKKILVVPAQPTIEGSFEMNAQTFSMMPPFEKIIETLAPNIVGTPGILRYQSDFGKEIERVLTSIAQDKGLPLLSVQSYEKIGAGDFRTQILKLKQDKVDVLFLDMLTPDVVVFKKQAAELGYTPQVISYSLYDAIALDENKTRYENDLWLDWQDTVSIEFKAKFEDRYGVTPRRGAEASYRAVYVLVDALETADPMKALAAKFTADHSASNAIVTVYKFADGAFTPLGAVVP